MQSHRTPIPRQTQMLTCHSWTRAFREEGFGAGRPHARGESGRFLSAPPHNTRVSPTLRPRIPQWLKMVDRLTHSLCCVVRICIQRSGRARASAANLVKAVAVAGGAEGRKERGEEGRRGGCFGDYYTCRETTNVTALIPL